MTQDTTNGTNSAVIVRFQRPVGGRLLHCGEVADRERWWRSNPAPGTTVHYDFSTTGVPGSTSSVDLIKQ